MALVAAPRLSAERLTDNSLTAYVSGNTAQWYEVWGDRKLGSVERVLIGSTFGNGTITRVGLTTGGDYLLWAIARNGVSGDYLSPPAFAGVSLAGMNSVLAAFRRTFAASASCQAALPGGLWTNEVPEDVEMPYGFVELLDSRYLWTTEDFHVEVCRVRVHWYAAGGERCETLGRTIRQLFDWNDLEFESGGDSSSLQVMPTDHNVQSEFARLRTGEVVFQGTTEYEVMVNRNTLRG